MSARVSVRIVAGPGPDRPDITAVAVKVAASAGDIARLAAEADRLRRFRHPGVIAYVDHRRTEDRAELHSIYAGDPLSRWRGTAEQAVGLAAALAADLGDLHAAGFVHGRIDPDHVLLSRDGRPVLCGLSPPDPDAGPADDVAAVGRLLQHLLAAATPPRRRTGNRRRGWLGPVDPAKGAARVILQAVDPVASRRPPARALATALLDEVPSACLPDRSDPDPEAVPSPAADATGSDGAGPGAPDLPGEGAPGPRTDAGAASKRRSAPPQRASVTPPPARDHGSEAPGSRASESVIPGLPQVAGGDAGGSPGPPSGARSSGEAELRGERRARAASGGSGPVSRSETGPGPGPRPDITEPVERERREPAGDPFDLAFADQRDTGEEEVFVDRPWDDGPSREGDPLEGAQRPPSRRPPPSRPSGRPPSGQRPPMRPRARRRPGRGWRLAPAVAGVTLVTAVGAVAAGSWLAGGARPDAVAPGDGDPGPRPCPEPAGPDAGPTRFGTTHLADVTGDGCPDQVVVTEDGVVEVEGERWAVGEPGDHIAVGDWDCDGRATPAVFRQATGDLFVFPDWADQDEPLTVRPAAEVRDGISFAGRGNGTGGGSCGSPVILLRSGEARTVEVTP